MIALIQRFVRWLFALPKPKKLPPAKQAIHPGDGGVVIRALTFSDVSRDLAERRARVH